MKNNGKNFIFSFLFLMSTMETNKNRVYYHLFYGEWGQFSLNPMDKKDYYF